MTDGRVRLGVQLAAALVGVGTLLMAAARVYDQDGRWGCYSETGDEYWYAYVRVHLAYLGLLWLSIAGTAAAGMLRPEAVPRWCIAVLAVSVMIGSTAGSFGYCG